MGHCWFLLFISIVKVNNLPLFTTISHKKSFPQFSGVKISHLADNQMVGVWQNQAILILVLKIPLVILKKTERERDRLIPRLEKEKKNRKKQSNNIPRFIYLAFY